MYVNTLDHVFPESQNPSCFTSLKCCDFWSQLFKNTLELIIKIALFVGYYTIIADLGGLFDEIIFVTIFSDDEKWLGCQWLDCL